MNDFKDIKGYEGAYQINKEGEVKSLKRTISSSYGLAHVKECIRKHNYNSRGVRVMQLSKQGVRKMYFIADLVEEAFPNDKA